MPERIHYFAYGSNLSTRRLLARTASARVVGTALLPGHVLRCHKVGDDGSGKCDALAVADEGALLRGVLWTLPLAEKQVLDRIEGLGKGYDEAEVLVRTSSGAEVRAVTYRATITDPAVVPWGWYREHVLRGMHEHRFPGVAIAEALRWPVNDDPDAARHAREVALYAGLAPL